MADNTITDDGVLAYAIAAVPQYSEHHKAIARRLESIRTQLKRFDELVPKLRKLERIRFACRKCNGTGLVNEIMRHGITFKKYYCSDCGGNGRMNWEQWLDQQENSDD